MVTKICAFTYVDDGTRRLQIYTNMNVKVHCQVHVMVEVYVGTDRGRVKGMGRVTSVCTGEWKVQEVCMYEYRRENAL